MHLENNEQATETIRNVRMVVLSLYIGPDKRFFKLHGIMQLQSSKIIIALLAIIIE